MNNKKITAEMKRMITKKEPRVILINIINIRIKSE